MATALETAQQHAGFTVYPNPATDQLTIAFDAAPESASGFFVYDLAGTLVHAFATEVSDNKAVLDISGLAPGAYLVRSTALGQVVRIIKQ
jgi:hypothetical protein